MGRPLSLGVLSCGRLLEGVGCRKCVRDLGLLALPRVAFRPVEAHGSSVRGDVCRVPHSEPVYMTPAMSTGP